MAWKGLHLTQPAKLSLADGQCCVKRDDGEVRIAIEDLAWIMLDTPHATLTSTLVSACMDAGVAIIFTDSRHTPSGLALPFHRHHRQGAVARLQAEAKESLKSRLWPLRTWAWIVCRRLAYRVSDTGCPDSSPAEASYPQRVPSRESSPPGLADTRS